MFFNPDTLHVVLDSISVKIVQESFVKHLSGIEIFSIALMILTVLLVLIIKKG